jgi:hypothetical protein
VSHDLEVHELKICFRADEEIRELSDRLNAAERHIRDLEAKNESDSEMYLKMLADTRCQFHQHFTSSFLYESVLSSFYVLIVRFCYFFGERKSVHFDYQNSV